MHGRFRIGLPKMHGRFRIGLPKVHGWFRIVPPQVSLNLLPLEFHSQAIRLTIGIMKVKQQKNLFDIEWTILGIIRQLTLKRDHMAVLVCGKSLSKTYERGRDHPSACSVPKYSLNPEGSS